MTSVDLFSSGAHLILLIVNKFL